MKSDWHAHFKCPWCSKEVTQPPLEPQTGLPLYFVCADCGSPVYFCSLTCWRKAHLLLMKAEGFTGKQARRKLLEAQEIIKLPPPTA